ncbi:MAG: hypothetical protein [Olavius algarvensis Gamma 1 endosymbiont]|nr:MAG: hypothetical protein [Olavius algarvensis Gamma 1 endosymbiont]
MSPERRAKGGLGCPVSHPEHGDTLRHRAENARPARLNGFYPNHSVHRLYGSGPSTPLKPVAPYRKRRWTRAVFSFFALIERFPLICRPDGRDQDSDGNQGYGTGSV